MEPWLNPLYDAEGMRAVDRWAIEEQGVPSLELMEAAGRGGGRGRRRAGARGPGPGRLRQGQQRRRRAGRRPLPGRGGLRGRGAAALAGRGAERRRRRQPGALPGRARWAATSPRGWPGRGRSSTRSSAPASRARRGSRPPPRSRRSTAAARRSSPATSPPGSTPRAARSRAPRSRPTITVSFHAAKLGHRVAPGQVAHRRAAGGRRSGSPTGAPSTPAAGDDRRRGARAWRRAAGARSTKFSSGQVTIAGGSRGLTGAVQMSSRAAIRAGAGYATVAVPADLEPIFEAGPARGDVGRLPGRRRLPRAGLGEGAAARLRAAPPPGSSAPAWAATPARSSWPARCSAAIEAPLVLDADGLNAFAGELGADRRPRGADGPHPARRRAGPAARPRLRGGRRPPPRRRARGGAAAAGAVVVLKGDDTIVTDGERVAVNALSAPGPRHRRHRRRALRHRRGAARPRPRAVRRRLRGGPRPRPRRPRRRRAGSAPPSR